jgi:hypothetical protein
MFATEFFHGREPQEHTREREAGGGSLGDGIGAELDGVLLAVMKSRRCTMGGRRTPVTEGVPKGIEDRVEEEEYRAQERVRQAEMEAYRAEL